MRLDAIHHVAFIVSDYDKSYDFYVNQLGFEVIAQHHRPDRHDYKLDLKCGCVELEIFGNKLTDPDYSAPPARISWPREACGLRHLAFHVQDVEATRQELLALGIRVDDLRYDDYTGKKMAFFYDPDGLPLELHE